MYITSISPFVESSVFYLQLFIINLTVGSCSAVTSIRALQPYGEDMILRCVGCCVLFTELYE